MDLKQDKWVELYGDLLYRYAVIRVRTSEDAEDLVQETLISAVQNSGSFAGKSSVKTWLIGILKHKILDYYRKNSRHFNQITDSTADIDAIYNSKGNVKIQVQEWLKDPEKALSDNEFLAILKKCIDNLPQLQKSIFVFREIDGLESEDICNNCGISSTNLGVLLHRARLRLRNCLTQNWFGN